MPTENLPFSIVELKDGVVLIPTKWIFSPDNNNEFVCYYPPIQNTLKVNAMVSKLVDPELTWKQYTVLKYLKKTSTLEKGKEKLLESLLLSEIDSENAEDYANNYKRSRQIRAKVNSLAENDEVNEYKAKKQKTIESTQLPNQNDTDNIGEISTCPSPETKRKPKIREIKTMQEKIQLPLPPSKRPRINSEVKNISDASAQTQQASPTSVTGEKSIYVSSKHEVKKIESMATPNRQGQNSVISEEFQPSASTNHEKSSHVYSKRSKDERDSETLDDTTENFDHIEQIPGASAQIDPFPTTSSSHEKRSYGSSKCIEKKKESTRKFENCLASLNYQDRKSGLTYEELSLDKLNEIILLLRELKIQPRNKFGSTNITRSFFDSDECPKLPISSQSELDKACKKLEKKSLKLKLIEALGSIGGRGVNSVIANICIKLFTNSLAKQYSWSGRNKTKMSLDETIFTDIIINSVKVTFPSETSENIKIAGSKWLAQAKTRFDRETAKRNSRINDSEEDNNENKTPEDDIDENEGDRDDADDEEENI